MCCQGWPMTPKWLYKLTVYVWVCHSVGHAAERANRWLSVEEFGPGPFLQRHHYSIQNLQLGETEHHSLSVEWLPSHLKGKNWFPKRDYSRCTIIHFNLRSSFAYLSRIQKEKPCMIHYQKKKKSINKQLAQGFTTEVQIVSLGYKCPLWCYKGFLSRILSFHS